jgi:hypothetical protein
LVVLVRVSLVRLMDSLPDLSHTASGYVGRK